MAITVELVDKYAKTFIDFWRLRPRRFFPAVDRSAEKYLTAPQFLVVSLGLVFAMLVASFALVQAGIDRAGVEMATATPEALAGRMVVFFVANLVVASLVFRAMSRVWPIKGSATFYSIFRLQCYMLSIIVPMAALDLLIGPIVAELIINDVLPVWSIFVQAGTGAIVGLVALFVYQIPGLAFLNDVSTGRVWCSLLSGCVFLGLIGGVAAAAIGGSAPIGALLAIVVGVVLLMVAVGSLYTDFMQRRKTTRQISRR